MVEKARRLTMRIALAFGAVLGCTALPGTCLWAEDRALVIGNQTYSDAADITAADAARLAARSLQTAGFVVIEGRDLGVDDIRARLSQILLESVEDGQLVILLSGHFAQSASQTWFLGTDASAPDLVTVAAQGVALATVLDVAATQAGGAVVLLGTEARRLPLGPGLVPGIGGLEVPQGVTLITGDAARIADFAARSLAARGQSLPSLLAAAPDLAASGFLSTLVPFRPADPSAPPVVPEGPDAESIFWQSTREQGTPEAFDAYLKRYPKGRFADLARTEAARIRSEPGRDARLAEEALVLSRDDRRAIQRALSLLDFNPRGVDGLFGAGSRNAIAAWQKANGESPTSFLTRSQVVDLLSQADRRAAELETEAALRRAELERQDQLYWNQTGAAGDEAGLRAYLKRFPAGIFADLAGERLAAIDADRGAQAAARDRAAWARAEKGNTIASYQDYLTAFPKGAFVSDAKARIEAATSVPDDKEDRKVWQATEDALGLSGLARSLIEGRLEALKLRPGPADGTFDAETRSAIRRFQTTRKLDVTGYLDQTTMVSLLAGGILNLGK